MTEHTVEKASQQAIIAPLHRGTLSPKDAVTNVHTNATAYIGTVKKLTRVVEISPKRPSINVG
jgi:hypothetical protein